MTSRKKVLLKVIILGDSGFVALFFFFPFFFFVLNKADAWSARVASWPLGVRTRWCTLLLSDASFRCRGPSRGSAQ